jgi:hypothetical protein
MDLQEIEVIIEKDGQVKLEVKGVKGPSCLDLTKDLEAALGGDLAKRDFKPDFYEDQQTDQNQNWNRM